LKLFFITHKGKNFLTETGTKFYLENNLIIDGASGGLVIGNSHDDDGVKLIHLDEENKLQINYEIEGFEFLLNPFASDSASEEVHKINDKHKSKVKDFVPYEIPNHIKTIDARVRKINGEFFSPFIIASKLPQMVINKVSTQRHLEYLDKLNRESWEKLVKD